MAPKRTTRANHATTTTTTITYVTDAQLAALIEQGIARALVARDADRNTNGDDSHKSGTAGSESRPPMLNKENYVPWSSRLLRYAKSRPNGKLIHNSILNGPYVRRMIHEPGDANRDVNVNETFHEQTDDELSEK
nr:Gag-Pol polyprotein [Tanacetum cinerariifolium]